MMTKSALSFEKDKSPLPERIRLLKQQWQEMQPDE